jgi:uncharacterized protein DUF4031
VTVRVDAIGFRTGPRGRKKYYHMTADTPEELHAFAALLGVKRCWFEKSRRGVPHYDLDEYERNLALDLGAVNGRHRK